ncbi:MAG: hypothetical protein K0B10_15375 [Vicingaceae bacterium]|nr:hypothetical protein [Vicingaceae bacterium]
MLVSFFTAKKKKNANLLSSRQYIYRQAIVNQCTSHYYVRLKNTPRGKFYKMSGVYWKGQLEKFVSNCPEVKDELKNNTTYWSQGWNKITMMYNSRCGH